MVGLVIRGLVVTVLVSQVWSRTYFGHEADYPEQNLVENPEFDGALGGRWEDFGSSHFAIATVGCFSGDRCASVTARPHKWDGPRYHLFPQQLEPNRHYWISFFIKLLSNPASDTAYQVELMIRNVSVASTKYYGLVKTSFLKAHSDRWIYLGCHFTTPGLPELSRITDYAIYVSPPGKVDYMMDAVSVTRVYSPDWRAQAEANIDTHRKSNIKITGNIPSCYDPSRVTIEINQTTREFPVGCALRADLINDLPSDVPADYITRFREYFLKRYDWSVFENAAKWKQMEWNKIEDSSKFTKVDKALDWLDAHGIKTRGHAIVWNKEQATPWWVQAEDTAGFTADINHRSDYFTDHYKNRFQHYDVSNEHCSSNYFEEKTENADIMYDIYQRVRGNDPDTKLFTNNFFVLTRSAFTARVCTNAMLLKKEGLLDAVGLQSHFHFDKKNTIHDKELIKKRLDIIRSVGLDIWITEVSVATSNVEQRADFLEDILYIMMGTPEVKGILFWPYDTYRSYCASKHGDKANCAFTEDLQNNAAGDRLDRILFTDFKTKEIYVPNQGVFNHNVRAFHGEYSVWLRYDGQLQSSTSFSLSQDHEVEIDAKFMCPSIGTVKE